MHNGGEGKGEATTKEVLTSDFDVEPCTGDCICLCCGSIITVYMVAHKGHSIAHFHFNPASTSVPLSFKKVNHSTNVLF